MLNNLILNLGQVYQKTICSSSCVLRSGSLKHNGNIHSRDAHIIPRERGSKVPKNFYNQISDLDDERSMIKIKKDPRDKIVILLGGETDYYVGMCESSLDNPLIYDRFKRAEQIFDWNVMDMCLNGPVEQLRKSKHALICAFMANMTALERAKIRIPALKRQAVAMTSNGIGELNALVFLDSMSFNDALLYLKIRSDALNLLAENSRTKSLYIWERAATNPKFMCKAAKEWCIRKGISERDAFCEITHWLHPQAKIIGGHEEAINFILMNRDNFHLQRADPLKVDLAYYSSYLRHVGEILRKVIDQFTFQEPTIMIHSTSGEVYTKRNFVKTLSEQVWRSCRLETNLTRIYNRTKNIPYPMTIECSPKRSISIALRGANFQAFKKINTFLPG